MLLGKTVSELDMSWREFVYWQEYLAIEPPQDGDNKRTAMLLAQITNMSGRSLPNNKAVGPEDFFGKDQNMQSAAEQIAFFKSIGNPDG